MIKLLGTHSDTSTCDCCGKTNLKRVVALELSDGAIVNYGTTCASKALRKNGQSVKKAQLDDISKALYFAQTWANAGHDAKTIASGLWDRIGFRTQAKSNTVEILTEQGVIEFNVEAS